MNWHHLASKANALKQRYGHSLTLPPLVYITDHTCSNPSAVIPLLSAPTLVMIRDYQHPERTLYASTLAKACNHFHHPFLITGEHELAVTTGANGIHLPEHQMDLAASMRHTHPSWWITSTAHTDIAVQRANTLPLDAIFISPVFTTDSHPDHPSLGIERFKALVLLSQHPVYALGGITTYNASLLDDSGASGLAAIRAFQPPFYCNP